MKAIEANNISIKQFLSERGVESAQDRGSYGMYHSPLRDDSTPSFKVDYHKNLWYDFGTGEGGTFIDLVMKIQRCDFITALKHIEQNQPLHSFSFHGKENYIEKSKIEITSIAPITNPALLNYAEQRVIPQSIIKEHCKEVRYRIRDKEYFAIGFKNDVGGYELRNRYFKGCTSKDITTLHTGSDSCLVFEGFIDALSFLTMKGITQFKQDTVILNSVVNLPKAEKFITSHNKVYAFLDNDEAGRTITARLKNICKSLSDQSDFYAKYKDLNAYLSSELPKQQKKQTRGLRI